MSKHTWHAISLATLLPFYAAAAPLSLDQAMNLAVQRSEAARGARSSTHGAHEAAGASGQLPDPVLRAGIENLPITGPDRFSTTSDSMTMKRIGISQEWVSRDKRAAREAAAKAMGSRAEVQVRAAEAEARLQTAIAYLDAWYSGAALKLATQSEHHAHEELEAARGRLASSAGGSAEVLALAASRAVAEDESEEIRQQNAAALVTLERWVGIAPGELQPVDAIALPTEREYVAGHPMVAALERDLDAARLGAAATAKERSPNWMWEVMYGQRTGLPDMITFGVSVPLQIDPAQRQDRDTAAKLAMADKAEAELAEASRAAAGEYQALASDASRLQQRIDKYRASVVALLQQRTASALAAYRSNQASLMALFEARHAELEAQRKLLSLQRDLAKVQAQLAFRPLTLRGVQ